MTTALTRAAAFVTVLLGFVANASANPYCCDVPWCDPVPHCEPEWGGPPLGGTPVQELAAEVGQLRAQVIRLQTDVRRLQNDVRALQARKAVLQGEINAARQQHLVGLRRWTSRSGSKSVSARLVAVREDRAVFKLANGAPAQVKIAALSVADQDFIGKWMTVRTIAAK